MEHIYGYRQVLGKIEYSIRKVTADAEESSFDKSESGAVAFQYAAIIFFYSDVLNQEPSSPLFPFALRPNSKQMAALVPQCAGVRVRGVYSLAGPTNESARHTAPRNIKRVCPESSGTVQHGQENHSSGTTLILIFCLSYSEPE
ncbi:hypothetical protein CBL_05855 [Carabus blaptoides fortunei]